MVKEGLYQEFEVQLTSRTENPVVVSVGACAWTHLAKPHPFITKTLSKVSGIEGVPSPDAPCGRPAAGR